MKRHPFRTNGSEFADLAFSNVAATFHQCLSPIVSKLLTQDKKRKIKKEKTKFRQGLLVKHIQELVKKPLTDSLVPGALRWWARVGNDRSIADCISGCRKAMKIEQKLAEKEPLGLKYT